jgi:hypothetical protein
VEARKYFVGCSYSWSLLPTRDGGAPYDTAGAAVSLHLQAPDGSVLLLQAVLTAGVWRVSSSLTSGGTWRRVWHVVDAEGPHAHEPIAFDVEVVP